ncbi:Nif3-like dinuclear metal center hexameric protein [Dictyobacter formicarum]|uniref:GTP cyclohydrolase 1 type 2 homolog n=1 Tax=Dictyobacter formicarum TaxID=2778368 RepID=A0ABQ3VJI2_9CHLR|nr:Nif3-like dinuclear metal center hexameric protein [Dictyobacter formicarum]GHO86327.1 hypothetical protein KSZ_43330 [Dictyobacter formicarum]
MAKAIQEVINLMIAEIPNAPLEDSVDTFKCGDPNQEVSGIVTTFTATLDVLRQAVALGANLIITHEPTFYDHRDNTDWLGDDPVYAAKRTFIEEHKLTIWRFHDYWHMHEPDGIQVGVEKVLGWENYQHTDNRYVIHIPPTTVAHVIEQLKQKLGTSTIRIIGDLDMPCQRIGMLLGSIGGDNQIKAFHLANLDVALCGETTEWQTGEYIRDAIAAGQKKALIILGHATSEEAGMQYLVDWLQPKIPEVKITFIPVGDPIQVV